MQLTVNVKQWAGHGNVPTSLVVDAGNITIEANANPLASSSFSLTIADEESASISVSQNGYYPYTVEITNVYDEDKSIDILLVEEINDINDPEYLMPHAYFFTFVDKCSFKSIHYLASSFPGNYKWLVNNECSAKNAERFVTCADSPGSYQVKMISETEIAVSTTPCHVEWVPAWYRAWSSGIESGNTIIKEGLDEASIESYLNANSSTNVTQDEYRPTFELQASIPRNTQTNRDPSCYSMGENVVVETTLIYNRPDADPANHSVNYQVFDPQGALVFSEEIPAVNNLTINFDLLTLGTYKVVAVLTDIECCETTYTRELKVETCDFVLIEPAECNNFKLINLSSYIDIEYRIEFVDGTILQEGVIEAPEEGDILGVGIEYKTSEIGIHKIIVEYVDKNLELQVRTYIVNNFCQLWDCLAEYVNELLCNPRDLCDPCPDGDLLNEMVMLNYTYSMLMNREFEFNNFYSLLDESKLAEYQTINKLAHKIKELCAKLNCNGISTEVSNPINQFSFGIDKGKSGGCGCGGNCGGCGSSTSSATRTKSSKGGCGCK